MVVRLSALRTGRLYPPGDIFGTHLCWRLSRRQGHSAAGRNQTQDLPACNAVRQPNTAPRTTLLGQDRRINLLTPNVNYSGRTAPLTSKVAFYIFIQQI